MNRKHNDLEQFIDEQRAEFDDAYPSLKLWADIEKELGDEKKNPQLKTVRPWYQIAATVLVLVTLGGVGGMYVGHQYQPPTIEEILAKVSPEFSETAQYYNQKIDQEYTKFASYIDDPDLDADFAQIDAAMADLREELLHAPEGREEQIVQDLIESYRLKLQILERVLKRIEQSNDITPNNNSNETSI